MSAPIVVFGVGGQVGTELLAAAKRAKVNVQGFTRAEADITSEKAIMAALERTPARMIVNAAAYTAVDRAESEPDLATAANTVGAEHLARAAAKLGVPLIHISTDFVFDGRKADAYVETDVVSPIGVYARTKAEGEERVRATNGQAIILRTFWVYGSH